MPLFHETSYRGRSGGCLRSAGAAALIAIVLGAGCAFETKTEEMLASDESPLAGSGATVDGAAGPSNAEPASPAAGGGTDPSGNAGTASGPAATGGASSGSVSASGAAGSAQADDAAMSDDDDAGTPPPASDAGAPAADAGTTPTTPTDAGAPPPASDAGDTSPADPAKCDADLAQCIIADPLNYDGCLRANAEQGCAPPDAGAAGAATTPVLDENGNPISQVCQAELAKCIMRNPAPENALECTETAMKCK